MFIIQSQIEFDSAHFLINSASPCDVLHGHRWVLTARLKSEKLNKVGFVVNFTILKKWLKDMTENFDHNMLNFYLPQTTAENMCVYFFMCLSEQLRIYNKQEKMRVEVESIKIAETPNNVTEFTIRDFDALKEKQRRNAIMQWSDPEKRKRIHDAIKEANEDPVLRHVRSVRMSMDNPMSKREVVSKMLTSLRKSQKIYPNNGEKKVMEFFSDNNLPFTFCADGSFILDGKIPDFINYDKKVVIEYNGRFWHSKNQWNDAYDDSQERIDFFRQRGYECYIIWDDEFEDKKEQIAEDLKKLLQ